MLVVVVSVAPMRLTMTIPIDPVAMIVGIRVVVARDDAARQAHHRHDHAHYRYSMKCLHASLPLTKKVPEARSMLPQRATHEFECLRATVGMVLLPIG
jgi:hypothetical protein